MSEISFQFEFNHELELQPRDQELFDKLSDLYPQLTYLYEDVSMFGVYDRIKNAMNSYLFTLKHEIHRLRQYEKVHLVHYEIEAVTDLRTCAFDRRIDHKKIKVEKAIKLLDALSKVTTKEELQAVRPLKIARSANIKNTLFPPFYLGCRATSVMPYDD